jgi:hypothetical protein
MLLHFELGPTQRSEMKSTAFVLFLSYLSTINLLQVFEFPDLERSITFSKLCKRSRAGIQS